MLLLYISYLNGVLYLSVCKLPGSVPQRQGYLSSHFATHTNTDTLYRQAPVTWHIYVSDSKGTGLTSSLRVSSTVGYGGEGRAPLCSRDVVISPPTEDMHYLSSFLFTVPLIAIAN